jgi:triphosphatase
LECLRHLQANQAALPFEPMEATHQMHIAIRRLKVAFRLFNIRDAALLEEIDWLNGLLGQARNWDVLLDTILPDALANCNFADVLRQRAVRKQVKSHQDLISGLTSQRYQTLLLTLGWLIAQPKLPISLSMKKLLRHHLISAYKKLPWRSETLGHLDETALHKTRIKLKRLRYMLEFFKLPDQQSTRHMTALQKSMGTLNDIHVGKALIESLAQRMPVEKKQHLTDVLDDWEQRRLLDAAARLETRWKKLRRKKSQAIDALPGKIL